MVAEPLQSDPQYRPMTRRLDSPVADDACDHQNLLLREADHRIKNSLSIVASMLMLQRGRVSDAEAVAALDDAAARVMAVADIHQMLLPSERPDAIPFASTLRGLCSRLGRVRSELGICCMVDDSLLMEARRAVPISLMVSELLLNSVKYADPPGVPGVIALGARLEDGMILLTVADHGSGIPIAATRDHFCQNMVRAFCRQLGGTIDVRTAPNQGTIVSIRVPLQVGNASGAASDETTTDQGARGRSAQSRLADDTMQQAMTRSEAREISLFDPVRLGPLILPNRVVMAPLTRSRASRDGVPSPLAAAYYAQRASAGLLIAEATNISPQGRGYAYTPGIYSEAQVEAWTRITASVHAHCGHIYNQLWHVGRVSHPDLQPGSALPVAPSAIAAQGQTFTADGFRVHLHCVEGKTTGPRTIPPGFSFQELRRRFKGPDVANNGYDLDLATRALREGLADLIAFGRPFLANPDLVARLRNGWALAEAPSETWYGGGAEGYIDWPTYRKPPEDAAANYRRGV